MLSIVWKEWVMGMKKGLTKVLALLVIASGLIRAEEVYIPNAFSSDPALSEWSEERMYESENFVVFWGPEVTDAPQDYSDPFNPEEICSLLEGVYTKYIDSIEFCTDGPETNLGTYKCIIVMNDTWGDGGPSGWAYGSGYDNTVPAMWVAPGATQDGYVISHEFAHGLQYMIPVQNPGGGFSDEFSGFFWEAHANYMRSQMYPEMAGSDMGRWMATAMYHYSSTRHHYSAFRLLYVIQEVYGINLVNRLWQEAESGEHPLEVLKKLQAWDQSELNDFIYEYAKREVAFDYLEPFGGHIREEYDRIKSREHPPSFWRRYTIAERVEDGAPGRYIVQDESAPQDYGYNIIPLYPENAEEPVKVKFKGHIQANNTAGWRYGFVALDAQGEVSTYSEVNASEEKEVSYTMSGGDESLYFVVQGAPTQHTSYVWEPGWPAIKRYPYEINIRNAAPEGHQESFRDDIINNVDGSFHPNGGGFVASTADVSSSVYVGEDAVVVGYSVVSGDVRIEDNAWVNNADLQDSSVIRENAKIDGGSYSGNAVVEGNALLFNTTVSGNAHVQDNAMCWNSAFDGTAVVGGDSEIAEASEGVYLQVPHANNGRELNDGAGWDDPSNQDVNNDIYVFDDKEMEFEETRVAESANKSLSTQLSCRVKNRVITFNCYSPEKQKVDISIHDIQGRCLKTVQKSGIGRGSPEIKLDLSDFAASVYYYRLNTGDEELTGRFIIR